MRATDGSVLMSLGELATEKLYSLTNCGHLTAESTYQIKNNAYSFGCTFAEVEVDIPGCRATLTNISMYMTAEADQSGAGGSAGAWRHEYGNWIRTFRRAEI